MSVFKKILVPTDFSESASNVYGFVNHLAKEKDVKVDLIHIIPRISYLEISENIMGNLFKVPQKYDELVVSLTKRLDQEMKTHITEANRGNVFVENNVKVGGGILEREDDGDYDLIVIGSRGSGNNIFKRGGVTEKLIRLAEAPVLSFNKEIDFDIETIVVPTDGSKLSFEALTPALKLAVFFDADVVLFSAMEFFPDEVEFGDHAKTLSEFAAERQEREIYKELKKHIDESDEFSFVERPVDDKTTVITEDGKSVHIDLVFESSPSAYFSIVNYAEEFADMVVMTTHGRTGLAKLLIGSVAEKVVHHLDLPVLTIRPDMN